MQCSIGKLVSRPVISVEADTLAIQALKLMSANRISCIIVLQNSEPVGILTERDVVFAANWVVGQPSLRVREVMSKPVLTAFAKQTLNDAYLLFRENRVRHLVVLGAQMEMVGIFTLTDLFKALKGKVFSGIPDVAALMSRRVLQVNAQMTARHALSMMASHAISGIVVVDGGRPVGVFTERDVVTLVSSGSDLVNLPVASVMTTRLVTIPAVASPGRAIDMMQEQKVRRLLVTDEHGAMVGILTQTDLSRVFERGDGAIVDLAISSSIVDAAYSPSQALQ